MKQLRKKLTVVFAMVAGASLCAAAVVACSSDDTTVTVDSGTPETGKPETGTPDTSTPDTGPLPDAGPDVIQVEASTLDDFIDQSTQVTCERLKECCGAAGNVDVPTCKQGLKDFGWAFSLNDIVAAGADKTKLAYDPVTGGACLTAARNLACEQAPAAAYKDSWTKCYAAVKGTVAANGACKSVVECAPTNYCETLDSGTDGGVCRAIQAVGTACEITRNPQGQDCSYRGVGSAQCAADDAGANKCTNLLKPTGAECYLDQDCASGACFYGAAQTGICSDKQTWYNTADCTRFAKPDAGDAGDGGDGG